jgi:hypothetical protein
MGIMFGDIIKKMRSGSASRDERTQNKARIEEMLSSMPKRWKRELEAARTEQRLLGLPVTPESPSVDDIIETVLEITAGEKTPGSSRWAGPRGDESVVVYDDIMEEAMHGLELSFREDYPSWKFIGLARAMQLATRSKIWVRSRNRAREYLRRHQKDKGGRGFGDEKSPSDGYMAYLNWGGEPAWETWQNQGKKR